MRTLIPPLGKNTYVAWQGIASGEDFLFAAVRAVDGSTVLFTKVQEADT